MSLEMTDETGKPRSDEDLQEAIDCVKTIMIEHNTVLPIFTVHAMMIKEFLEELKFYRSLIAEQHAKRNTSV